MKLKDYLDTYGIKNNVFADRIGIGYVTFYAILKGKDMRLSLAAKIVKATKGEVSFEDLIPGDDKISNQDH